MCSKNTSSSSCFATMFQQLDLQPHCCAVMVAKPRRKTAKYVSGPIRCSSLKFLREQHLKIHAPTENWTPCIQPVTSHFTHSGSRCVSAIHFHELRWGMQNCKGTLLENVFAQRWHTKTSLQTPNHLVLTRLQITWASTHWNTIPLLHLLGHCAIKTDDINISV
jgi:hypothetical protein